MLFDLQTIRLRKIAKNIGFEKLVLRKGRMNAYFPSNPESTYYKSGSFASILELVKEPETGMRLKQEGSKLFLGFHGTETIVQGLKKLEALLNVM